MAHKQFGRTAGLSKEQITDLVRLDPDRFDARTHAALIYVRALLTEPEGVPPEIEQQFKMLWPLPGRNHVIASMKGMFNTNLVSNTWVWLLRRLTGRKQEAVPEVFALPACPPNT
jgi:hypothetical protein